MASLTLPLSNSFKQVPPVAIPPMLDCLLASTGLSAATIFDSLLGGFTDLTNVCISFNSVQTRSEIKSTCNFHVCFCFADKRRMLSRRARC